MASTREKLLATTSKFVDTFNPFDVETMLSVRSSTCLHRLCCPSFDKITLNNEQARECLSNWGSLLRRFDFCMLDENQTLVDEVGKTVLIRTKTSVDTVVGGYENEYVLILRMTEDCTLVEEILEFYDTIRFQDLQRRLEAHQVYTDDKTPFFTSAEDSVEVNV